MRHGPLLVVMCEHSPTMHLHLFEDEDWDLSWVQCHFFFIFYAEVAAQVCYLAKSHSNRNLSGSQNPVWCTNWWQTMQETIHMQKAKMFSRHSSPWLR